MSKVVSFVLARKCYLQILYILILKQLWLNATDNMLSSTNYEMQL